MYNKKQKKNEKLNRKDKNIKWNTYTYIHI